MNLYTAYADALQIRRENPGCFMRIRWVKGGRGYLVEGIFIRRSPLWLHIQLAIADAFLERRSCGEKEAP